MFTRRYILPIAVVLGLVLFGALGCASTPTLAPTATSTATATPTMTPTPASAPTPTPTATSMPSATSVPTNTPTPIPTATPNPTATPTPTATPVPMFPLTLTGSDGKAVVLQAEPERIIAFDAASVETLFAMGAGEKIVGTHSFVFYPPEAASIPKVGDAFNLDLEKIAELQPDFFYTFFKIENPQLSTLGVPTLWRESPGTLDEIPDRMRMWGRILGEPGKGESLARAMEMEYANLKGRLAGVQEGPRIFYDTFDLWTPGPDTFQGDFLRFLKAQNIASDISGWAQLSAEVLVERDPEVILLTPFGDPKTYTDNPAFSEVSAVKNGRIYNINADYIDIPGPRIVQGLEEVGRLLYPELFK